MEGFFGFSDFFRSATGYEPLPFQVRMAEDETIPSRVSVPTGLGKTAMAVLGWLYRRRFADKEIRNSTPRRLVYCLPMRVLVEQTTECVTQWLKQLELFAEDAPKHHPKEKVAVHVLMGGDLELAWDNWPDRDQILIGTQDMLLSRAMNRGYAMSRFRWPMHFALLNNDCLWVMDEIQLMGSGLAATTQIQAFRRIFKTILPVHSMWMSATMRSDWLNTVDFQSEEDAMHSLGLESSDMENSLVSTRINASKILRESPGESDAKDQAERILREHREKGGLTLVIVNRVRRAVDLYEALEKMLSKDETGIKLILLHSRFRPPDKKKIIDGFLSADRVGPHIVVSTQVVEAGVDISAKTLFTDLAPWSSLVQRFGRCNRKGEYGDEATIWWFDIDRQMKNAVLPYTAEELDASRKRIKKLENAAPKNLKNPDNGIHEGQILRRQDIVDLFDTTPDLAGADIDVSRFIREEDDSIAQVSVFWRDVSKDGPTGDESRPRREELCPVPLLEVRNHQKKHTLWMWDHLEKKWKRAGFSLTPGMVLMADAADGAYSDKKGWDPKMKKPVSVIPTEKKAPEGDDDDSYSQRTQQTIAEHTDRVVENLEALIAVFKHEIVDILDALRIAARLHDWGKAHNVFQNALVLQEGTAPDAFWAKASQFKSYDRRGFRHELASALAMLRSGYSDLSVYLAAAHHGKVRLSIRSLPHENPPDSGIKTRFARGIWDGDILGKEGCTVDLGGGEMAEPVELDLSYMEMGDGPQGASWLARMLALREKWGPFRLAFFETLLRVADWRGSQE